MCNNFCNQLFAAWKARKSGSFFDIKSCTFTRKCASKFEGRVCFCEIIKYLCRCDECEAKPLLERAPASEVDHIVPVAEGGTDAPENLRAINSEHHKLKTQEEARRGVRRW